MNRETISCKIIKSGHKCHAGKEFFLEIHDCGKPDISCDTEQGLRRRSTHMRLPAST